MLELLALLLPVAAVSGWFAAMRHIQRRQGNDAIAARNPGNFYIKGLNYLLNDKPEEAVDYLSRALDNTRSSVESRIALGNLLRRAGEVEQAISIHKRLVSQYTLSHKQHIQSMYELGLDFVSAGLFDRAETAFDDLKNDPIYAEKATQQLLRIYQHEKEWAKAIECTRKLAEVGKAPRGETESQFYCEMAEQAFSEDESGMAKTYVRQALNKDPGCVRANLMRAQIEISERNYHRAVETLNEVADRDSAFVPEIIQPLMECYKHLGNVSNQIDFLEQIKASNPVEQITLILAQLIRERDGVYAAEQFMWEEVRNFPSIQGIDNLLGLLIDSPQYKNVSSLEDLKEVTSSLVSNCRIYRCSQCGFNGRQMHWCCPGCHYWESIRPISKE